MARTVEQLLTNANDSVTLINQINSGDFSYFMEGYTQEIVNRRVQENVNHLEIILSMSPINEDDPTPDVAGSSVDKSSYTTAIATGKQYITDNS
jgi:archaellum component FlaC|tara:strand:- start:2126 stop:2407 length:282 start_codon:yes stop_codon:yes gene_type:complete